MCVRLGASHLTLFTDSAMIALVCKVRCFAPNFVKLNCTIVSSTIASTAVQLLVVQSHKVRCSAPNFGH
jgi:hypothetical protein